MASRNNNNNYGTVTGTRNVAVASTSNNNNNNNSNVISSSDDDESAHVRGRDGATAATVAVPVAHDARTTAAGTRPHMHCHSDDVVKDTAAATVVATTATAEAATTTTIVAAHGGWVWRHVGAWRARARDACVPRRLAIALASALVVLLLLLVVYVLVHYYSSDSDRTPQQHDHNDAGCVTPFGASLGAHDGVVGYSNCNDSYVSHESYRIDVPVAAAASRAPRDTNGNSRNGNKDNDSGSSSSAVASTFSGMKWQCVEYARRYWLLRGRPSPATFGDVECASDIWTQLREATLLNGTRVPLRKHSNGVDLVHGGSAPRVADLVIYTKQDVAMPCGHVAVVVGVDFVTGRVYIAEQNWDSGVWPAPHHNYSRTLPMHYDAATSRYTLDDPPYTIAGWVRYDD